MSKEKDSETKKPAAKADEPAIQFVKNECVVRDEGKPAQRVYRGELVKCSPEEIQRLTQAGCFREATAADLAAAKEQREATEKARKAREDEAKKKAKATRSS